MWTYGSTNYFHYRNKQVNIPLYISKQIWFFGVISEEDKNEKIYVSKR